MKLLCQAKAQLAQGQSVDEMCRQLGIRDSTYYYWCKQYGKMGVDQAKPKQWAIYPICPLTAD